MDPVDRREFDPFAPNEPVDPALATQRAAASAEPNVRPPADPEHVTALAAALEAGLSRGNPLAEQEETDDD